MDYYNDLINTLLEKGIEPMVTLFHWDLPLKLQDDYGGFNNSAIVDDFEAYADLAYSLFGDRVTKWMTMNEPHSYCWQGHDVGAFPPSYGDATGFNFYRCAHNMILAHAKAYRTYYAKYQPTQGGEVSITINAFWAEPRDPNNNEDIEAAQDSFRLCFFSSYAFHAAKNQTVKRPTIFMLSHTGLIQFTKETIHPR